MFYTKIYNNSFYKTNFTECEKIALNISSDRDTILLTFKTRKYYNVFDEEDSFKLKNKMKSLVNDVKRAKMESFDYLVLLEDDKSLDFVMDVKIKRDAKVSVRFLNEIDDYYHYECLISL